MLVFCLLAGGCTANLNQGPRSAEDNSTVVATELPILSSATETRESVGTIPVTLPSAANVTTPTLPTPRPTATRRPTPTLTLTPLPTVPADQVSTILSELSWSNGRCALPCWWGMTPGESKWVDHEPFLQSFAKITKERRDNPNATYYVLKANLPEEHLTDMNTGVVSVVDGIIDSIDTGGSSSVPLLHLPDFLSDHGKPDEVWLSTYSSPRAHGTLPFRLFLVYSRGIVAQFELADVPVIGDNVVGCYTSPYNVFIRLVAPERQVTFEGVLLSGAFSEDQIYLPLKEATGTDVDTFLQTFANADSTLCLETPSALWED